MEILMTHYNLMIIPISDIKNDHYQFFIIRFIIFANYIFLYLIININPIL